MLKYGAIRMSLVAMSWILDRFPFAVAACTPQHLALGVGDHGEAVHAFGRAMGFPVVRV